jgi:hypothetical protein
MGVYPAKSPVLAAALEKPFIRQLTHFTHINMLKSCSIVCLCDRISTVNAPHAGGFGFDFGAGRFDLLSVPSE